ncbi:MAG: type II toxin-antitoxin system RelE/ParE family toxin [Phycisphaerales bacterium]
MSFRVIITREVEDTIDAHVVYLKEQSTPKDRLGRWLSGLFDLIDSLYEWPRRFAVAEAVSAAKGYEVRRANYGDYAIFFRVDDERQLVEVIAFRHGRQRPLLEAEE